MTRDDLGRAVRDEWVAWAKEQPACPPRHLVPWDELDEATREVDRRIGEAVLRTLMLELSTRRLESTPLADVVRSLCRRRLG